MIERTGYVVSVIEEVLYCRIVALGVNSIILLQYKGQRINELHK
jgi:hypothetical protein